MSEKEIKFYNFYELIKEKEKLQLENKQLKKQLEYLRSNEYLNQVKWERNFNEELVKDLQQRIDKASEDLGKIIDHLNNKTIISLYHFTHQLEIIQDELVGGNDE